MTHLRYQGPNGTIAPIRFDIGDKVDREMNLMREEVRIALLANWASLEREEG